MQKIIVYLDCWFVHRSKNIHTWYRTINWLITIFVPSGCTPIFQQCDVKLQRLFKHHVRFAASDYFVSQVQQSIAAGTSPSESRIDLQLRPLRDQTAKWVYHGIEKLNQDREFALRAWSKSQVRSWNLSWDPLISTLARETLLAKYDEFMKSIIGMQIPVKPRCSKEFTQPKASYSNTPVGLNSTQTQLNYYPENEGENNEPYDSTIEDEDDVLLEVV